MPGLCTFEPEDLAVSILHSDNAVSIWCDYRLSEQVEIIIPRDAWRGSTLLCRDRINSPAESVEQTLTGHRRLIRSCFPEVTSLVISGKLRILNTAVVRGYHRRGIVAPLS